MKKEYSIYVHTNKANGKKYVGMALDPKKRWGKEGKGYQNLTEFYSDICKYGWDCFDHEILLNGLSREEAEEKERELIASFNSHKSEYGYNKGLGGIYGHKFSESTKKKISIAGRHRFEKQEEHEKLSRAAYKRNQDPVKYKNICEGNRRRWEREDEHRKITDGLTAYYKNNPERKQAISEERRKFFAVHPEKKTTKAVLQLQENGCFIREWVSMTEAAKTLGIGISQISAVCRGIHKTAGGYIWRIK